MSFMVYYDDDDYKENCFLILSHITSLLTELLSPQSMCFLSAFFVFRKKQICMIFCAGMVHEPRKSTLHFGVALDKWADPGIFILFS